MYAMYKKTSEQSRKSYGSDSRDSKSPSQRRLFPNRNKSIEASQKLVALD